MDNKETKPQTKMTILAGVFAIVTAIISGSFLILNTVVEHKLSSPTETPVSTITATSALTQLVATATATPNTNTSATVHPTTTPKPANSSSSFLLETLNGIGALLTFALLMLLVYGVTVIVIALFKILIEKVMEKWETQFFLFLGIIILLLILSSIGAYAGSVVINDTKTGALWGLAIAILILIILVIYFWNPFRRKKK